MQALVTAVYEMSKTVQNVATAPTGPSGKLQNASFSCVANNKIKVMMELWFYINSQLI